MRHHRVQQFLEMQFFLSANFFSGLFLTWLLTLVQINLMEAFLKMLCFEMLQKFVVSYSNLTGSFSQCFSTSTQLMSQILENQLTGNLEVVA